MFTQKHRIKGFTIVELLIIIVIIAILAAITIVAYNGLQARSRDAKRAQDFATLQKNIMIVNSENGGVPHVNTYGGNGPGGWDVSYHAPWLTFIKDRFGSVPIDPINISSGYPDAAGERTYFYYCYPAGQGPMPATAHVSLGYRTEVTDVTVRRNFEVDACL